MTIRFSRHARRRMNLYKIDEKDVLDTIQNISLKGEATGKKEVINENLSLKYGHPLKVIFFWENDKITVVSVYPFIRRHGA